MDNILAAHYWYLNVVLLIFFLQCVINIIVIVYSPSCHFNLYGWLSCTWDTEGDL